jgi:Uma2 family endonuclease
MIICDLEEKLDEKDYYKGIPSLVVEILSDSTRSKDMIKKLDLP